MTEHTTFVSTRRSGFPVLEVKGEFDIGNVAELGEALRKALEGGDVLIVTLGGVAYLDSSAIGVLIRATQLATTQRRRILVVAPRSSAAGKLLRIAAVDQIAPMFETVDDAVATLGQPGT